MPQQLEITYRKSVIGYSERQRRTVRALGLGKLHSVVRHEDTPTIRGMVHAVRHLVDCREIESTKT
jgi:large subunit ribosomal protein L30